MAAQVEAAGIEPASEIDITTSTAIVCKNQSASRAANALHGGDPNCLSLASVAADFARGGARLERASGECETSHTCPQPQLRRSTIATRSIKSGDVTDASIIEAQNGCRNRRIGWLAGWLPKPQSS